MDRIAAVYFNGILAGFIQERTDQKWRYQFQYDASYLAKGAPLSFRLPVRKEAFTSKELFPFFENLAAEGWMKQVQSTRMKIDEQDTFGLLIANGKDLIGAVTLEEVEL